MGAAENEFLRKQLKIKSRKSPAFARMVDAELVLRFLTLRETWSEFGRPYRESLDDFMRHHVDLDDKQAAKLRDRFDRAIAACEQIWGELAFRRPTEKGWRDQLITAMFDAEMVAVDQLNDADVEALGMRQNEVVAATEQLVADDVFVSAVTVATNNRANVRYRVQTILDLLSEMAAGG